MTGLGKNYGYISVTFSASLPLGLNVVLSSTAIRPTFMSFAAALQFVFSNEMAKKNLRRGIYTQRFSHSFGVHRQHGLNESLLPY